MQKYGARNNVCLICKTKTHLDNEQYRVNGVLRKLQMMTSSASKEEIEKRNEYLKRNSYVNSICDYHERCKYGMPCQIINSKTRAINDTNNEIVKLLLLLLVMNKAKAKELLCHFRGYYPKAARFIQEFNLD